MPTRIPESDLNLSDRRTLRTCDVISVTQQVNLARLIDVGRKHRGVRRIVRQWTRAISRTPPPPSRATAAAAWAAARSPLSERSAVCAKPVVSPTTTRMPAPRSRPELSSFNSALIKHGRGRRAIFDEHLGEFTAARHRLRESVLENFLAHECVRHVTIVPRDLILSAKGSFRVPSTPKSYTFE